MLALKGFLKKKNKEYKKQKKLQDISKDAIRSERISLKKKKVKKSKTGKDDQTRMRIKFETASPEAPMEVSSCKKRSVVTSKKKNLKREEVKLNLTKNEGDRSITNVSFTCLSAASPTPCKVTQAPDTTAKKQFKTSQKKG